ncbi:hypothetical protein P171DRAFT_9512 [Karstenula rhodostoma CBS 690.94]|uniref:Sin-N domain containing protein n=1 Tax=Karstenula rhodostoma CBS 690.94 TaxID=1392251 RepID=A0A9P4UIE6_9PLEO|nr:hypothetical protein P171DRAFT_9512 [Karstenula rhodostoma CBS 690.94]
MAPAAMDDADPVIAEYDVFITPEMEQQLYVLQYLNRRPNQPFVKSEGAVPSEVRVKEQSGFIEVDVALPIKSNFNRQAGVRWGEAMRKTKQFGQKAYGIASGFERAMPRTARPGAPADGRVQPALDDNGNEDEYVVNFEDANEKGHVLNTQTYGGQLVKEDGKGPTYMLGTFKKNQLHLTRLNGLVQLRTQFHHLDAVSQLEAAQRRREKESQDGAKPTEPKAFMPTVKKAGGDTAAEITQAFMKTTNAEKWNKLIYHYEDADASYAAFEERLFLADTKDAPKLHSSMSDDQYLEAISAPSGGKGAKKKSHKRHDTVDISDDSDDEVEQKPAKAEGPADLEDPEHAAP